MISRNQDIPNFKMSMEILCLLRRSPRYTSIRTICRDLRLSSHRAFFRLLTRVHTLGIETQEGPVFGPIGIGLERGIGIRRKSWALAQQLGEDYLKGIGDAEEENTEKSKSRNVEIRRGAAQRLGNVVIRNNDSDNGELRRNTVGSERNA